MRALITKYAGTEAAAVHSPSMEERIFLAVIVSAMAVLVGLATMLVFGTANSVALVRQPQQQTPVTPPLPATLPLGTAAAGRP
ncbi:MAG: hypothetical protein IJ127_20950 [Afipia sp.]|nr:hypothetical protein [Afipia sp.]